MAISDRKITTYTANIKNLSDTPNDDGITAAQLKALFDGRTDSEVKTAINGIVDDLVATTDGASGADQIGATALKVGGATTVQGQLEEVKVDSTLALSGHTSNSSNPHSVNKAQVGLGNVDNTSDADKPVSTAQATADALAVHKAGTETITGTKVFTTSPTVPTPTADTQAAPKKYVDDSVSELDTAITNALNTAVDTLEYAILDVDTVQTEHINNLHTEIQNMQYWPYIGANGDWYVWNAVSEAYVDTGIAAQGATGATGAQGPQGEPGTGVALGETSSTAYRGDRGKTAYDHSQAVHAPSTMAYETSASNFKTPGTAAVGSSNNVARSDHVHPAQTSVSGNAGTATKLATARKINGINFDGSADITIMSGITTITTSSTISLAWNGCFIKVNSSSAVNITIPLNSSVAFPVGAEIEICKYGAGTVTIVATSGVTIVCSETTYAISAQYKSAFLKQIATDTWLLQLG